MTFSTRNFDPLTPLAPKFCCTNIAFSHETLFPLSHMHNVLQNFYTTWVRGVACQKQRLGPKLEGAELGEHPKIWDPLHISATVEASNFKFGIQLGFGTSLPKKRLGPKLVGVWTRGPSKKIGTPYVFLQSLKLAISNLVHKLGLGLACQNTMFMTKIGGSLG